MKNSVLIIYNANLVDSHISSPGLVIVKDKKIKAVSLCKCNSEKNALALAGSLLSEKDLANKAQLFNAEGLTLMPSFTDTHVHFRYPGQTQKEDLDSGLRAAVAGGYGTLVLMPNTSPVVSTKKMALDINSQAAERKLAKTFQTISITKDFDGTDTSEIDSIDRNEIPVISEDGKDVANAAVMLEGMKRAGKLGITVACHCEDTSLSLAAKPYRQRALGFMSKYKIPAGQFNVQVKNVPESVNFEINGNFAAANNLLALAEDIATERNIEIAKLADCHIHICHCSTAVSMDAVRRAKEMIKKGQTSSNFDCTVEITPHHLSLVGTDEDYIRALVNPPLRSEADRRALIDAVKDGTVDCIGTDHAPHTLKDKAAGSPGFTGIETAFAVCNTILVKAEGLSLSDLSRLMSDNPSKMLRQKSGRLLTDYDANLVLVDPDETWTVDSSKFFSKGKSTPLEGARVTGRVHATFFEGEKVFELE